MQLPISDRDGLVDWLCKPFQAPGAHVADCSKPVKTGEENRLHAGLPWNLHYLTIILFSRQYWEGLTDIAAMIFFLSILAYKKMVQHPGF